MRYRELQKMITINKSDLMIQHFFLHVKNFTNKLFPNKTFSTTMPPHISVRFLYMRIQGTFNVSVEFNRD